MSHTKIQQRHNDYELLYSQGMSTTEVAHHFGVKKNTVLRSLWLKGVLRPSRGKKIEIEVAAWTAGFAQSCFRMPGDHPFDLQVDGVRVNVKSAARPYRSGNYHFVLSHSQTKSNYQDHVDQFYLVFCGLPGRPVYALDAQSVNLKGLNVPSNIDKCKYNLQFLGLLGQEVIST